MRHSAALITSLLCLSPLPVAAEPFQDTIAQNPYLFNEELRMLLHDEPDILASALTHGAELRSQAVWSPLRDEIETDLSRISALADDLFAQTPQGFGGEGRAGITLFTQLACDQCARAEAELQVLAASTPGLRVELRSRTTALPDRLSYAVAHVSGAELAEKFRRAINEMDVVDETTLLAWLYNNGQDAQALLRVADAPETMAAMVKDVQMFNTLGLDTAPSYVLPRMLIRGHMPSIVLSKYLVTP